MTEMAITARTAKEQPKYRKTAAELLKRCRDFYADPENEREYQEWKKQRSGRNETVEG